MAYLDAACRARYARLPRVHLGRHPAEVSIHARPGRGARPSGLAVQSIDEAFQSTRAPGGARDFGGKLPVFVFDWFQSTRAPGGARDGHDLTLHAVTCCFNPRAPREGRATLGGAAFGASREVSIHARPGRGARPGSAPVAGKLVLFQSTRAPGGARDLENGISDALVVLFQSTRAPGGARDPSSARS